MLFDRIAVWVGVAAGLVILAAALFVLTHRDDLPTPGDDDLMALPAELPGPNGYEALWQADALRDGLGEDEFRPRVRAMLAGTEWEPVLLDELLRRNASALEALARGVATPGRLPGMWSAGEARKREVRTVELLPLVDLIAAEAIGLARRGERDAAIERALSGLHAGRMLADYANLSQVWLGFAAYWQGSSARVIDVVLRDAALTSGEARALAARIEAERIPSERWQAPWATDYRGVRDTIFPEDARVSGYLYQRNRSLAVFAGRVRELQRSSGLTCRQVRDETGGPDPFPTPMQWVGLALTPNPLGRVRVELAASLLSFSSPMRCLCESKLGLAQLAVALNAWTHAEGALPETLDALVPDYLESIPRDAFDGAPLRYSKAKAVVYSIGTDLVDSGGEGADLSDSDEPAISVAF
jgi:hypothetical protein